jgi:hypothetical protein
MTRPSLLGNSGSLMDDGLTVYTPGVNCIHCGRFVGRDGALYYEECATCVRERAASRWTTA